MIQASKLTKTLSRGVRGPIGDHRHTTRKIAGHFWLCLARADQTILMIDATTPEGGSDDPGLNANENPLKRSRRGPIGDPAGQFWLCLTRLLRLSS